MGSTIRSIMCPRSAFSEAEEGKLDCMSRGDKKRDQMKEVGEVADVIVLMRGIRVIIGWACRYRAGPGIRSHHITSHLLGNSSPLYCSTPSASHGTGLQRGSRGGILDLKVSSIPD